MRRAPRGCPRGNRRPRSGTVGRGARSRATAPTTRICALRRSLDQSLLAAEVADEHDRVALPRLEHGGQRQRLVGLGARVPEHDRVSAFLALDRERLDRLREERIGDVTHDRSEQHRRRAAQRPRERVRTVAELLRDRAHPLARLVRDARCCTGASLRIRETVLCATPAAAATSFIVAGRGPSEAGLSGERVLTSASGREPRAGAATARSRMYPHRPRFHVFRRRFADGSWRTGTASVPTAPVRSR